MTIKRHKYYRKDALKVQLTDDQYAKRIQYLSLVLAKKTLPPESKDHELRAEYRGFREFHLGGDMLVVYTVVDDVLYLQRMGTHSQLFK
ncbi:MAG TPA: type II toxin-antitoxin system YafQ family toxin [Sulfurovum sp.]|nr:type II toxin-antitoxin system YafQ family toxin [Sulfurovum sp.]